MTEQIDIFKRLDFIRDHAAQYAGAKANRVYCEEYRKTLKSQLMKRHVDSPVTAQEREAYADESYKGASGGVAGCSLRGRALRWLIEGAKLKGQRVAVAWGKSTGRGQVAMSNSVQFRLIGAPGGTVIDPDGPVSVVKGLFDTYGDRLDWDDLLEAFEERAGIAEFEGSMSRAEAETLPPKRLS